MWVALFGKPLLVNTVSCRIYKYKLKTLRCKVKAIYRQQSASLGPQSGNVCFGLTSPLFQLFLEKYGHHTVYSGLKRKKTIQIVTCAKLKSLHLWWYGDVIVHMAWVTCICEGTINTERYRFWSKICCVPGDVFFRDVPVNFCKTVPSSIMHITCYRNTASW